MHCLGSSEVFWWITYSKKEKNLSSVTSFIIQKSPMTISFIECPLKSFWYFFWKSITVWWLDIFSWFSFSLAALELKSYFGPGSPFISQAGGTRLRPVTWCRFFEESAASYPLFAFSAPYQKMCRRLLEFIPSPFPPPCPSSNYWSKLQCSKV